MALRIRIERTEVRRSASGRRGWTVAVATVVAGILVTGVSYAYWTTTGSGSATVGSLGVPTPLTVSSTTSVVADLYPGKQDALSMVISNPNAYPVNTLVGSLGTSTSSNEAACAAATYLTLSTGPFNFVGVTVPAATNSTTPGTVTVTIPNFVTLKTTAPNGCQSLTFTFPFTVSGLSA